MSKRCPFPHLHSKENAALTSTPGTALVAASGAVSGGRARSSVCSLLGTAIGSPALWRSYALRIRSLSCTAPAILIFTSGATAARAYAHLDHAVPAVASTVRTAPDKIELSFNEAVEPAFSSIEVIDQAGGHVELEKLTPGPDDAQFEPMTGLLVAAQLIHFVTVTALFGGASLRARIDYPPASGAMDRHVSGGWRGRSAGLDHAGHQRLPLEGSAS